MIYFESSDLPNVGGVRIDPFSFLLKNEQSNKVYIFFKMYPWNILDLEYFVP